MVSERTAEAFSEWGVFTLMAEIWSWYHRKVSLSLVCYCYLNHSSRFQLVAYSFYQVRFSNAQTNFFLIPNIYNIPASGGRIKNIITHPDVCPAPNTWHYVVQMCRGSLPFSFLPLVESCDGYPLHISVVLCPLLPMLLFNTWLCIWVSRGMLASVFYRGSKRWEGLLQIFLAPCWEDSQCLNSAQPFLLRASWYPSTRVGVHVNATPSPPYLQNWGLHFWITFPKKGKSNIFVTSFYVPWDERSLSGFFGC